MRLARFNIQSGTGGDKRYFVGMPSPAAAAVPAATVFAYPLGLYDYREALPALAMVIVPAVLMVSTIRFRSFKNLDLQSRRPFRVLLLIALGIGADHDAPAVRAARDGLQLPGVGVHRHGDHASSPPGRARGGGRRRTPARPSRTSPRGSAVERSRRSLSRRVVGLLVGSRASLVVLRSAGDRQRHRHRRADAALALHLNRPAVQFDVALRDGEAEARCRSPSSRSTARRSAPRDSGSMPTPVSVTITTSAARCRVRRGARQSSACPDRASRAARSR